VYSHIQPLNYGSKTKETKMRKKQHISQLETQVAELMATVNSLLEVVTKPNPKETKTPTIIDSTVTDQRRKLHVAPKAGMKWSEAESTLLMQLWDKGLTNKGIGKIMGRSEMSIGNQVSKIRNGQ
jgi:DNA-binding NarL/FixJ family response regulator